MPKSSSRQCAPLNHKASRGLFCSHTETCAANVEKFGLLKKSTHLPLKGMHEWVSSICTFKFIFLLDSDDLVLAYAVLLVYLSPKHQRSNSTLFSPLFYSTRANNKNKSDTIPWISELHMPTVQPCFVLQCAEHTSSRSSEPEFRLRSTPLLLHLGGWLLAPLTPIFCTVAKQR